MNGGRWTPGIGDPSVMGWITVIAYFAAALLCFLAGRKNPGVRRIWWSLTLFLVLLGVNKQLDLQSWFTQVGRDMAKSEGWYESRASVQQIFIGAIILGGAIGSGLLFWITRLRQRSVRIALVGLALLLAFIAVRASSFHHVDLFLGLGVFGVRFNWIFELGGIAIIAAGASRAASGYYR